jgi:hypothetical protein
MVFGGWIESQWFSIIEFTKPENYTTFTKVSQQIKALIGMGHI